MVDAQDETAFFDFLRLFERSPSLAKIIRFKQSRISGGTRSAFVAKTQLKTGAEIGHNQEARATFETVPLYIAAIDAFHKDSDLAGPTPGGHPEAHANTIKELNAYPYKMGLEHAFTITRCLFTQDYRKNDTVNFLQELLDEDRLSPAPLFDEENRPDAEKFYNAILKVMSLPDLTSDHVFALSKPHLVEQYGHAVSLKVSTSENPLLAFRGESGRPSYIPGIPTAG